MPTRLTHRKTVLFHAVVARSKQVGCDVMQFFDLARWQFTAYGLKDRHEH